MKSEEFASETPPEICVLNGITWLKTKYSF